MTLCCLLLIASIANSPQAAPPSPIKIGTDVGWLEQLVLASDLSALLKPTAGRVGQDKDRRTEAYARLGELATPESLAALRRIDAALAARLDRRGATIGAVNGIHPAWHFGDSRLEPMAQIKAPDGRWFGVIESTLLGAVDLFLVTSRTPEDRASWSRPRLTPVRWYPGMKRVTLTWKAPGALTLRYEQEDAPPPDVMEGAPERAPARHKGPREHKLNVAAIERDTDGDGWTDLEEARLGLDARRADSDGDGRPDGRDVCPNLATAPARDVTETQQILRRALFAVFSVGGSTTALLIEDDAERVHVEGYGGPILYGIDREAWLRKHGHGGVFVTWKILRQERDEATVEIVDWEGMMAAGGQNVILRKIDGAWIVVSRVSTWVS